MATLVNGPNLGFVPAAVRGCSEISQLGSEATRCQIDPITKIKTCFIEKSISVALHPVSEAACISVSSADEKLGQMEITTEVIKYQCNYQFWYFTRDYTVDVEAVHRCRQAKGSQCFDDFCETVKGHFRLHGELQIVTVHNSIDSVSSDWWGKPAQVEAPFKNILNALINLFVGILKFVLNNPTVVILLVIAALIVFCIVETYLLPEFLVFSSIKRFVPILKRPFSTPRRKSHIL